MKHEEKHWEVSERNSNRVVEIDGEFMIKPVCDCHNSWSSTSESSDNARLISAAPDMLRALKAFKEWQEIKRTCGKGSSEDHTAYSEFNNLAEQAIKKAEGE